MFALLIYKLKTKREPGEPLGAVLVGFISSSSSLFSSSFTFESSEFSSSSISNRLASWCEMITELEL